MLIGPWNTSGTAVEAAPATDENRNNIGKTAHSERKRFIEPTTPPLGIRRSSDTHTAVSVSPVFGNFAQPPFGGRAGGTRAVMPVVAGVVAGSGFGAAGATWVGRWPGHPTNRPYVVR